MRGVDLGVHLPLIPLGAPLSAARVEATVDAARASGFAALAANDHLVWRTPWLDGPTALASVIQRSGRMALATTVALPVVRGPAALAKALMALDLLSEGRLLAGVGPGSSADDYAARRRPVRRALAAVRRGARRTCGRRSRASAPACPCWIGSWGSAAGLRRVARAGDGWLASAYNTTPDGFAAARAALAEALIARDRPPGGFPNAVATMWAWVARRPGRARPRAPRRARAAARARPGRAGAVLCRQRRALRRAAGPLCRRRLRPRLPVARSATSRVSSS